MTRRRRAPAVLLVDSAEDNRVMYAEFLKTSGLRTLQAATTRRALTLAPKADVVVTAVRVAGPFDGLELVRRLHAEPRTSRAGVIILTACVFDGAQRLAEEVGCDAFLTKPCLPEDLLSEIHRLLQSRERSYCSGAK
jgi:two-component system, cell cycle response regulator DivK